MSAATVAAPARPAASLLLLRGAGPEILMGLRGAGHRFMPNRLVFPGGSVDPADAEAAAAAPLSRPVAAHLARTAGPGTAQALAMAAVRELEEETGLSLGRPPALDGLDLLCRAITPEQAPIRFDAWFFLCDAARAEGDLAGSGELEGLRWYGLEEARALDLAFPTRSVLDRLGDWLAMSAEVRAARAAVPTLINRLWTES